MESLDLSEQDIDRLRQWFSGLQDVSPQFIEAADIDLAQRIHDALGLGPVRLNPSVKGHGGSQ